MLELALHRRVGARKRFIVLGRISAILPNRDNDLLRLNLDAVGIIDFDQGTVAIDAVLVDSRLAHSFALTGAMALRIALQGHGPALRARGRRHASRVHAAGGLPEAAAHRRGADHRRQPAAHLRGVLRPHLQYRPVRRARASVRGRARLQRRGRRRLRRADPARPVPLPRRVPRQHAAEARLAAISSRSRSKARSKARCRCACAARRRSRSSGGTSRSRFDATLVERRGAAAHRRRRRARRAAAARSATCATGRHSCRRRRRSS